MRKRRKSKKEQISLRDNNKTKTSNKDDVTCFGCGKQGHFKSECPELKKDAKKKKKKALMSIWEDLENDSSDEDDYEAKEVANLCFMANQENEVSPSNMSYDELLNAFDDLLVDSKMMLSKYANLKKQNELLTSKVDRLKSKLLVCENK